MYPQTNLFCSWKKTSIKKPHTAEILQPVSFKLDTEGTAKVKPTCSLQTSPLLSRAKTIDSFLLSHHNVTSLFSNGMSSPSFAEFILNTVKNKSSLKDTAPRADKVQWNIFSLLSRHTRSEGMNPRNLRDKCRACGGSVTLSHQSYLTVLH